MIWPVDSSVSQEYGSNPTANLPADSWLIRTFGNYQPNGHTGVDFPVVEGTPVRAVTAGTVKHVGWYTGSYADNPYWIAPAFAGFVLVIDHGAVICNFAHLSGSPVAEGETEREGQTVAD
jgi:murein DD-endopeptidase MepM/ murein hydrolase activator NlpD